MVAFTILGLLVFWWFCWELGYHIAMFFDAKARIDNLCKPVASELEVLIAYLSASELNAIEKPEGA